MTAVETWRRPSLWRVVVFAMVLALLANTLLWRITRDDDWFANVVAVASGVGAVALLACWFRFRRWLDDALLFAFFIWAANTIEFALEDVSRWENQVRQCGMYLSQALLALGAYVASRVSGRVDYE